MKIKKIIFIDDVGCLGQNMPREGVLYIALNPKTYSYLSQKGLSVKSTESYFTNRSQEKALKQSDAIIRWLREHAPTRDIGFDIKYAYTELFVFWVRLSVHYFLWATEIVNNAIAIHQPEIVSAPLLNKQVVVSLAVRSEERHLGYIVRKASEKNGIAFEDISGPGPRRIPVFFRKTSAHMANVIKFPAGHIKFQLWLAGASLRNAAAKGKTVYFTTKHYQMDAIAGNIGRQIAGSGKVCFFAGPVLSYVKIPAFMIALVDPRLFRKILRQRKMMLDFASSVALQKDMLSLGGISFSEILAEKIKNNIADHITSLYIWSSKLNRCLNVLKPAAFVSNGNRSDDVMLTELCSKRGIPTILISHGSHTYPKNEYERIEWGEHGRSFLRAPFSSLALQTPLAEEYLKAFPSGAAILRTGPLVWGSPVNKGTGLRVFSEIFGPKYKRDDVRVIVHAGTPKLTTNMRLYVYETPDEYLQALSYLADTVNAMKNTLLIIRFRPSREIGIEELKNRVAFSDKVVLNTEGPFVDTLGTADLLISFSSTTIEEALQNNVPVLLYGGGGRYQHIQAYEVTAGAALPDRPIYHVVKDQDLAYAISGILDRRITEGQNARLFEPYKYAENARVNLAEVLI